MAKSIWSGAISFGLVSVPVKMFIAVRSHKISFNQLNKNTGARIQQKRVDASTGEEVPYENIVAGYDLGSSNYVLIEPEELDSLAPIASRTINIDGFVDEAEINPIYYDNTYYLSPDEVGAKPYKMLQQTLDRTGKAAIGTFIMRGRQHIVAIRSMGDRLAMSTLHWGDEVSAPDEIPVKDVEVSDKELNLAEALVDNLSKSFDITEYQDEFTSAVMELIHAKAEGRDAPVINERDVEPISDLLSALAASVEASNQAKANTAV